MSQVDESWFQRPEGLSMHESAGGIVARVDDGTVFVALITEKGEGTYVLPKGHVEPGESIEQAARREILEEAGFRTLRLVEYLGFRERMSFDRSSWKKTHYFLFQTDQVEAAATDPAVDGETVWFPLEALPEFFWPEQRRLVEEHHDLIAGLGGAGAA